MFRYTLGQKVEFMTVMWFTSQKAIPLLVGNDRSVAYVPANAQPVLARFAERIAYYEVRKSQGVTPQR